MRKFYTVTEAAPLLDRGRTTLYRLIRSRQVPHSVDSLGRIRFTEDDIAAAREHLARLEHRPAAA